MSRRTRGQPKVLVVDDEPDLLELLPKSPGAIFRMTFKRALTPALAAQAVD